MTWINGRSLNTYTDISKNLNINYKYNRDGIRVSKVVNEVETKYYLENSNIIYEQRGDSIIYYLYDLAGLIGLEYNGNLFYYIKNLQGDIIGILDSSYNQIVSYEYDSWGKVLCIKDSQGNEITDTTNIGLINPFRYRGYYYDSETELYYLNSRYYNPEWGRFINADGVIGANQDLLSYNLYAYVSNNPINYGDSNGKWSFSFKSILKTLTYLIDPLGSTRKLKRNSTILKEERKQISVTKEIVNKSVEALTGSFIGEVGVGTGLDLKVNKSVQVGYYQDVTYTYKDSEITSNIMQSNGVTVFDIGTSTTKMREYPISEESCGYGFSPYSSYVMTCPEVYNSGTDFGGKYMSTSGDSVFIGIDTGVHLGVGFHIKIGWEINTK